MAFIQLGVFQPGVLKATGRTTGDCYNEGSYNKRFLNEGFLQAGIVRPAVLKTWGSNKQGFLQPEGLTTSCLTTRGSYKQLSYKQPRSTGKGLRGAEDSQEFLTVLIFTLSLKNQIE